jgi:hypothetical protein
VAGALQLVGGDKPGDPGADHHDPFPGGPGLQAAGHHLEDRVGHGRALERRGLGGLYALVLYVVRIASFSFAHDRRA